MTDTQKKPEVPALRLAEQLETYHPNTLQNKVAAELRRLHGEVEALRADAERYRKLKTMQWYVGPDSFWCDQAGELREYQNYNNDKELDIAIDAAMKEKP